MTLVPISLDDHKDHFSCLIPF